ncbi:hypothetical protein EXM90_01685 [Clostridium botulinum]|nr:hypothetical protein [Clostridium botulinum]NFA22301.1 hypothetical protein [Clostridium botulinum]NFA35835.1 hypothetical protein [Clostridium botulinum]NFA81018.1 hypothetical protein [Clostridium botulinum]NFB62892.1 hypothetical protein [Clostridium botulinum]
MDFDWLFYLAKVHLNYSKEEFWDSTHAEIYKMWGSHIKFNHWEIKDNNEENNPANDVNYKRVNIENIPFL